MDFFTPIVDEPYDWGRIAAANALSDVYAMGGHPLTALQLVGWPRAKLPMSVLSEVMLGGADTMAEAGTTISGGHSIDSEVPLYGFAVTGIVDPSCMTVNTAAKPGDAIVLTKPLGTGVVATAVKQQSVTRQLRNTAVEVMSTLNGSASSVMVSAGVRCATDVTGYGLLGHLREIVDASMVSARLDMASVPILAGVRELVEAGVYPGGSMRNLGSVWPVVTSRVEETDLKILADAQTSGGLLMAVPQHRVTGLLQGLEEVDSPASVIGKFVRAVESPGIEVA